MNAFAGWSRKSIATRTETKSAVARGSQEGTDLLEC